MNEPLALVPLKSAPNHQPPPLNPFAFPTDTDFRFILLILAVVGVSLFIYVDFFNTIISSELADNFGQLLLFMGAGGLLTLGLTTAFYWFEPQWKIVRRRMQPLQDSDIVDEDGRPLTDLHGDTVMMCLQKLGQQASLTATPKFMCNWGDLRREGQAFGRMGNRYIYLAGGLLQQFTQNPSEFRAWVLHELAHLHNGDIDKTYFTIAIQYGFAISTLPFFIFSLLHHPVERFLQMGWRILFLFALVEFTCRSILRVREFYADVRATSFQGQGIQPEIRNALQNSLRPQSTISFWRGLWTYHPNPALRQQVLENPSRLLNLGAWTAFATGMVSSIAFFNIEALFLFALLGLAPSLLSRLAGVMLIPALGCGWLIVYVIGVGIWRKVLSSIILNQPVQGLTPLSASLASGLVMGWQTSIISASQFIDPPLWSLLTAGVVAFLGCRALFSWIATSASLWLQIAIKRSSPSPFYQWGLLLTSLMLGMGLTLAFQAVYALFGQTSVRNLILFQPLVTVILLGLWVVPLSAWFWQKRTQDLPVSDWVYLAPVFSNLEAYQRFPLQPGFALTVGLLGGILGAFTLGVAIPVLTALGGPSSWTLSLVIAAWFQIVVAGIITMGVKGFRAVQGLFGAFIAGCFLSVGALITTGGIPQDFGILIVMSSGILNIGGLLTIPTVIAAGAISSWLQHPRRSQARQQIR